MRRVTGTIAVIALGCILALRLPYLYYRARPPAIRLWFTVHRLTRVITHAQAPLLHCDLPADHLIPNSYSIILKAGYTVPQHKAAVGRGTDLEAAIDDVFEGGFPTFQTAYYATIEDPSLLDSIRADPGVVAVECDVVMDSVAVAGFEVDKMGNPL